MALGSLSQSTLIAGFPARAGLGGHELLLDRYIQLDISSTGSCREEGGIPPPVRLPMLIWVLV